LSGFVHVHPVQRCSFFYTPVLYIVKEKLNVKNFVILISLYKILGYIIFLLIFKKTGIIIALFGVRQPNNKTKIHLKFILIMEDITEVDIPKWITITQVAHMTGISAKTIARWEKIGRIRKAKRNWRGWRIYEKEDIMQIKNFLETVF
jgi:hypothetical protein